MALDNADFISQLSIVDPPGTDAIAEGDDHIRTVKRATQQSFPNVDAAVPQTAAQMGQMAIKNEVNVFTQANQFATGQLFTDEIRLQQVTGFGTQVRYQTDVAIVRWQTAFTAVGDFDIQRFSVVGNFIDNVLSFAISNGRFTFANTGFFNGGMNIEDTPGTNARALSFNTGGANDWSFTNDNTGANLFRFRRFINGAPQADIFSVANSTGETTWARNVHMINPNIRFTMSDSGAGSSKLEMGLLSDNSAFAQGRRDNGTVSWILRADLNNSSSYVSAGSLNSPRFGVGTSSPQRTLHVAGPSGLITPLRITGLPLSNAGLVTGDCFQSSGFIAIVP